MCKDVRRLWWGLLGCILHWLSSEGLSEEGLEEMLPRRLPQFLRQKSESCVKKMRSYERGEASRFYTCMMVWWYVRYASYWSLSWTWRWWLLVCLGELSLSLGVVSLCHCCCWLLVVHMLCTFWLYLSEQSHKMWASIMGGISLVLDVPR